eukprot:evm.model.scf_2148.3 EVM.evm.TU.scf_2148.3   scf_2148:18982-23175(-)
MRSVQDVGRSRQRRDWGQVWERWEGMARRRSGSDGGTARRPSLWPSRSRRRICRGQQRGPVPCAAVEPSTGAQKGIARAEARGDDPSVAGGGGEDRGARLRVAIDVDEVLGQFLLALNHFCRERYAMEYCVDDYSVYDFAKVWGCSQDMSNHIVHEFFKSPQFGGGIPVMPGSQSTLCDLATWCDLVVVTSRQHVIQEPTLEWLTEHFPGVFQDVHFGNHFALDGEARKKSEICREIDVDVLVDDNPSYAIECAGAGLHVVLYDWQRAYPWSKLPHSTSHPLIQVAEDWTDVKDALTSVQLAKGSITTEGPWPQNGHSTINSMQL